jgi:alpha-L-fucosidase
VLPDISERHFETVRGMGRGFGYNQSEGEDDYDSAASLIHLLADVASKNGNLLLNVGPMADGTIPAPQMQRLQAIGAWLAINGEAIFDTRPWSRAAGATTAGTPVRYTASRDGGAVYAILLGSPAPGTVTLRDVGESPAVVELLGRPGGLVATRTGDDLAIDVPGPLPDQPAHAFALRR